MFTVRLCVQVNAWDKTSRFDAQVPILEEEGSVMNFLVTLLFPNGYIFDKQPLHTVNHEVITCSENDVFIARSYLLAQLIPTDMVICLKQDWKRLEYERYVLNPSLNNAGPSARFNLGPFHPT